MKLEYTAAAAVSGFEDQSKGFKIAMNGKAFRVLSSGLYKDKIGSIVREISFNAKDAHVDDNKAEVPFEVHLPDDFEPYFAVRDFGKGLSNEDMETVYTTYFTSTKDQSNTAVGAFGLGSKSPFSYTDSFTVTSWFEGEQSTYSAHIGADGQPNLLKLSSVPSTEPSGLEVRIASQRQDFSSWNAAAATQLQWIDVKPKLNKAVNFPKFEVKFSYGDVHIAQNAAGYSQKIIVVQGGVGYSFTEQDLDGNRISAVAKAALRKLGNYSLRIDVAIGSIGVTASREGVEYDNLFYTTLNQKLEELSTACEKEINSQLSNCATLWDKAVALNKADNPLRGFVVGVTTSGLIMHHGGLSFYTHKLDSKFINLHAYKQSDQSSKISYVQPKENTFIVYKDKNGTLYGRLEQHQKENNLVKAEYYTISSEQTYEEVKKLLGDCPKLLKLSELPLPKTLATSVQQATYYTFGTHYFTDTRKLNKQCNKLVDLTANIVYLRSTQFGLEDAQAWSVYHHWNEIKEQLKVDTLIVIRSSDEAKVKDKPNFKSVKQVIEELKPVVNKPELVTEWVETNALVGIATDGLDAFANVSKYADKSGAFTKQVEQLQRIVKPTKKSKQAGLVDLVATAGKWTDTRSSEVAVKRTEITKQVEKLKERYPMLSAMVNVRRHFEVSEQKVQAQYVNTMDDYYTMKGI